MSKYQVQKHSRPQKHIALAFPIGLPHLQATVRGIAQYADQHANWTFLAQPERVFLSVRALSGWGGDGVIAELLQDTDIEAAKSLNIPVVNITSSRPDSDIPRVTVDNRQVGKLAGQHLLSRGFKQFAYYGIESVPYARDRLEGLKEAIGHHPCHVHNATNVFAETINWQDELEQLRQWLRHLSAPIGLFCANDYRARMAVDACRELGRNIPDDIALVGVDNNRTICELSEPYLTSIGCNRELIGYQAAALLDQIMNAQPPTVPNTLIPPQQLYRRTSTNVGIYQNTILTHAYRWIKQHIHQPFGVEQLTSAMGVSRRCLERHFRDELDCTPHDFISQLRIEEAQILLKSPERSLTEISYRLGFRDPRRFRLVFRRVTGMSPTEYRQQLETEYAADRTTLLAPQKARTPMPTR